MHSNEQAEASATNESAVLSNSRFRFPFRPKHQQYDDYNTSRCSPSNGRPTQTTDAADKPPEMFCYWGEDVREGFGLVKPGSVTKANAHIRLFRPKPKIRQVSVGSNIVGFIREDGTFSCIKLHTNDDGTNSGKLKPIDLKKEKIKLMSCGEDHAVLLTYGGKVYFMDQSSSSTCRPIKAISGMNVIQIACGDKHSMALTKDGQLFTWGQNSNGQLGLGKGKPSFQSPQPLMSLSGIPLAQISAGGDQSFALSLSGTVFGWGKNSAGQLGLGDREDRDVPNCVNSLSQKITVFISCGAEHTATLSKGGTVFTFGSGCYGQLGHNSFSDELRPRVVAELWGLNVSQIACGRHHTLTMVEKTNTIYTFGRGEQRQLGNGRKTNQSVPLPIRLPTEASNGYAVKNIIAGGNHSVVLCSKQSPAPTQKKVILTLDQKMIDRWFRDCDTNEWKTVKKEINTVFSSAACLNGSFLMQSCDRHYQTSKNFSGLDLESVRTAMEQIAEKEKVLSEVEKVVEKSLSHCVYSPVGVEAVRVYLILPEILRVLKDRQHAAQLTGALASAIINLPVLQLLKNYWSDLPLQFLKTWVDLFRDASENFLIKRIAFEELSHPELMKVFPVLQTLYNASCHRRSEIGSSNFIIHDISFLFVLSHVTDQLINTPRAFNWTNWEKAHKNLTKIKQHYLDTLDILMSAPCIFNMEAKCILVNFKQQNFVFNLEISRTALVEDCFNKLRDANEDDLKGKLQVIYSEKSEKDDVHKKDFFDKVFEALRSPTSRLFMYNDTETLIWFPSKPTLEAERYHLFGILCGLVFNNNSIVYLPFPLALFKKLMNIAPSLEDLKELSSDIGKSLQYILDYSDDDAENMDINFRIVWDNKEVELDPNEPEKVVTSSNKKEFVDAYVDYVLNKSVQQPFEEFKMGFYKVCDPSLVKFFQPEELRGVMVGTEEYDWNVFKKNTTYAGLFDARHSTIVSFWEVFDELSDKDKRCFLLFLTGFDRVPILGMNQVNMTVRPLLDATQDFLPQALTCFTLLELPMYQSKHTLRTKLIEAIHHKRGFWED